MLFERKKSSVKLKYPSKEEASFPSVADSWRPAMEASVHEIFHGNKSARCYTGWDKLVHSADARVRVCPDCKGQVYRLTDVPEDEISKLLTQNRPIGWVGEMHLHRRFDGTYTSSLEPCFTQSHSQWCSESLATGLLRTLMAASVVCVLFGTANLGKVYVLSLVGIFAATAVLLLVFNPLSTVLTYSTFESKKCKPSNLHACHRLLLVAPCLYILSAATAPLCGNPWLLPIFSYAPLVLLCCQALFSAFLLRLYKKDQRPYFRSRLAVHLWIGFLVAVTSAVAAAISAGYSNGPSLQW